MPRYLELTRSLFEGDLLDILRNKGLLIIQCHDANMRFIRIIAMVMLALLYLGGTYAQLAGAAFPIVGTGKEAYGDFTGKGKEPCYPTISPRRHMPMVKLVSVSPVIAVDQAGFGELEKSQSLLLPCFVFAAVDFSTLCRNDRAPPLC